MRKLVVFNQVTLDGYFTGVNGDLSWAHKSKEDREWNAFVAENARGGGMLLFGRKTYELMAGYWPTDHARENDGIVADRMNSLSKVVFSRTLEDAPWSNTTLVKGDLVNYVRKLKEGKGANIAILGSGSLIPPLMQEGLIDEYALVVNPVVLGKGRTMFEGLKTPVPLQRTATRTFSNGNVLVCYEPVL